MQTSEFEKQLQQQMDQFKIDPDNSVWQKVEVRITKDKKRKRFIAFWFIAGLMLFSGGIILFNNLSKKVSSPSETSKSTSGIGSQEKKPNLKPLSNNSIDKLQSVKKQPKQVLKSTDEMVYSVTLAKKSKLYQTRLISKSSNSKKADNNVLFVINDDRNNGNVNLAPTSSANPANSRKSGIDDVDNRDSAKPPAVAEVSSNTSESNLEKATISPKSNLTDSVADKPVIDRNKKESSAKWKIGLSVLTGISNNIEGINIGPSAHSLSDAANYSQVSSSASGPTTVVIPAYKSSFSWGAGVYFEKALNKRFSFSVGLGYHNFGATLSVGQKIDSTATIFDSVLNRSTYVSSFYRSGQAESYGNVYHLLMLPLNFSIRINGNEKNPINFSAGITPGILLSTNALYLKSRSSYYYQQKNQFQKLQLSFHSGLSFPIYTSSKLSLNMGPHFQYQMNNLTKPELQSNQHLYFIGIKTNIVLKK